MKRIVWGRATSSNVMKVLLRSQIQRDLLRLKQRVEAFEQQLRDQGEIETLWTARRNEF